MKANHLAIIYAALLSISEVTDTPIEDLVYELTGTAWDEEDGFEIRWYDAD